MTSHDQLLDNRTMLPHRSQTGMELRPLMGREFIPCSMLLETAQALLITRPLEHKVECVVLGPLSE
ncbi:MAG: hypothetical protein AB7P40_09060 [Chloroflexota bacterium]